jgi:hypothetical protein
MVRMHDYERRSCLLSIDVQLPKLGDSMPESAWISTWSSPLVSLPSAIQPIHGCRSSRERAGIQWTSQWNRFTSSHLIRLEMWLGVVITEVLFEFESPTRSLFVRQRDSTTMSIPSIDRRADPPWPHLLLLLDREASTFTETPLHSSAEEPKNHAHTARFPDTAWTAGRLRCGVCGDEPARTHTASFDRGWTGRSSDRFRQGIEGRDSR